MFSTYLSLGFRHISDLAAYDHLLFLVALCALYSVNAWRSVLLLVTAFTIGHSLTLALAAFDFLRFPAAFIEFLIPLTILITSFFNILRPVDGNPGSKKYFLNYLFALGFGLIHGMGFSNFLRASLMPGEESRLITQLFAFNLGIELGQILIVGLILAISTLASNLFSMRQRDWTLFVSGATGGISLTLLIATWPF